MTLPVAKQGNRALKIGVALLVLVVVIASITVVLSNNKNNETEKTGDKEDTVTQTQTPAFTATPTLTPASTPTPTQTSNPTSNLQVEWQRYLPGIQAQYVIQTSDGGFLVLGHNATINPDAQSFTNPTSLVVKTDSSGNLVWVKTFSTQTEIAAAMPTEVIEVSDGYVFSGNPIWGRGVFIFKTSFDGDLVWSKIYGHEGESVGVHGLIASHEGGYTMLCSVYGEVNYPWIVKVDSSGNLQWNKTIAQTGNISIGLFMWISGSPCAFVQTDDNGYAILCSVGRGGISPVACELIKTDSDGNLEWCKGYGGAGEYYQLGASSMTLTTDGYLIACQNGTRDACIIKSDLKGDAVWNKTYTYNNLPIFISSVVLTRNGGFIMLGSVFDHQVTGSDATTKAYAWVAVADKDGDVLAQTVIEMVGDGVEIENIIQTNDGGYVFVGVWNRGYLASYEQKIWLVKLSSN
jgi:hypothetical protein